MLVFHILDGSPDDNVRYVFWMIQQEYSTRSYQAQRKTVYTYLKLGMICNVRSPRSSYPELKGRSAQAKQVGPILLEIWKKKMDVGNQVHTCIQLYCVCVSMPLYVSLYVYPYTTMCIHTTMCTRSTRM